MSWNVMVDYNGVRIKEIIAVAPQWLNKMYMEPRKNPKIIHYAGPQKPWLEPEMDFAQEFWEHAKTTSFYEVMLWRMGQGSARLEIKKHELHTSWKRPFRIVKRGFRCLLDNGALYTARKIKNKIRKINYAKN